MEDKNFNIRVVSNEEIDGDEVVKTLEKLLERWKKFGGKNICFEVKEVYQTILPTMKNDHRPVILPTEYQVPSLTAKTPSN